MLVVHANFLEDFIHTHSKQVLISLSFGNEKGKQFYQGFLILKHMLDELALLAHLNITFLILSQVSGASLINLVYPIIFQVLFNLVSLSLIMI